ncbi:MAG: hypothetical protein HKN04_08295 [Rhodothermaceae bacterium]|nr:hypothetical protein [Rhodothermaceae bacterium]
MDIVKYFYEEPAALHAVPDGAVRAADDLVPLDALLAGPRFYRGYLAGTCLQPAADGGLRVGATALENPAIWIQPLLTLFDGVVWTRLDANQTAARCDAPAEVLADPRATGVLVVAESVIPVELLQPLGSAERREGLPALRALLADAEAVLFPEPAHDGFDWSVFASTPLRERLAAALRAYPAPGARRFVLPYQRARSEHRFYFEQWQLDALPDFIEEV